MNAREECQRVSWRGMSEWQFRRVRFPMRAPLVFDCRFNGAAEQIVQGRYQTFLNDCLDIAQTLRESGRVDCLLDQLTPDIVHIMREVKDTGFHPNKICARLKYHRIKIAEQVAKDIGRVASGDVIRRMGIGDQLVLIGTLQAIERKLGAGSVSVVIDELYPASFALFSMSGLPFLPLPPHASITAACPRDATLIDLRRHFLEHPLQDGIPCYYGEDQGSPLAQFLWNLGWEYELPGHVVSDIRLAVAPAAEQKARHIHSQWGGMPYVTCQPLELTRLNAHSSPSAYSALLQLQPARGVIFGASPSEVPKLTRFIKQIDLPKSFRTRTLTEPLPVWLAVLKQSGGHFCGNSSGMWLGFCAGCHLTILSRSGSIHGTMWEPKPSWMQGDFAKRVTIIG